MRKLTTLIATSAVAAMALAACSGGIEETPDNSNGSNSNESAGNGQSNEDAIVIRYSTQHTDNTPFSTATARWADLVKERTEGRVEIEMYYSESLLPADQVLPGIIDGRAEAGFVVDTMFADLLPLTNASAIPFERQNGVAQALAFQEMYENNEGYRAEFEELGLHVLMFQVPGASHIGSQDEISTLDDLQGQDIRCIGYICDSLQAVGANPVALASTEIYEAMDRGTIDGWSAYPFMDMLATQFQEVTPYVADPGMGMYLQTFSPINLDTWNSIEPQDQEVLTELAREYPDIMMEEIHNLEKATCEATTEAGVKLSQFSEADQQEWNSTVHDDIFEKWTNLVNSNTDVDAQDFYSQLMAAYDEAEAATDFESLYTACMEGELAQ